ncbi:MAG: hypothetical protein IT416_00755 [Candidatus Pacebacteria bacterium]|nr:hypothetical protein [Candidatus Paceibacterota bacterium]
MKEAERVITTESKTFQKMPEFIKKGIQELAGHFGEIFQSKQESNFLLGKMLQDEKVRVALLAVTRTVLNIGISVVDVFPGIGEVVSLGADLAKLTKFDLTPDVNKGWAWGTEIIELFTGGVFPSHAIETTMQFIKDFPRIKEGAKRAKKIWEAHQAVIKTKKVQDAASVFAPAPMAV